MIINGMSVNPACWYVCDPEDLPRSKQLTYRQAKQQETGTAIAAPILLMYNANVRKTYKSVGDWL